MKNSKSIFFNIIAFFIFIVIMVVFVLCKDSTNKITSPFLENGYYIQVESKSMNWIRWETKDKYY